jgi:hypothetical protein
MEAIGLLKRRFQKEETRRGSPDPPLLIGPAFAQLH